MAVYVTNDKVVISLLRKSNNRYLFLYLRDITTESEAHLDAKSPHLGKILLFEDLCIKYLMISRTVPADPYDL